MNSTIIGKNAARFLFLIALQVILFKGVDLDINGFQYLSVLVYPIFILIAPIKTRATYLISLSFLLGLLIDVFYESLGVHAGASVLSAFLRPMVLKFLEPRGGYELNSSPSMKNYGFNFFIRYTSIILTVHLLAYFSLEVFTPVYFVEIITRTVFSLIVSVFFIMLYQFLFNPKL